MCVSAYVVAYDPESAYRKRECVCDRRMGAWCNSQVTTHWKIFKHPSINNNHSTRNFVFVSFHLYRLFPIIWFPFELCHCQCKCIDEIWSNIARSASIIDVVWKLSDVILCEKIAKKKTYKKSWRKFVTFFFDVGAWWQKFGTKICEKIGTKICVAKFCDSEHHSSLCGGKHLWPNSVAFCTGDCFF